MDELIRRILFGVAFGFTGLIVAMEAAWYWYVVAAVWTVVAQNTYVGYWKEQLELTYLKGYGDGREEHE